MSLPVALSRLPVSGWENNEDIESICLKCCNTVFQTITSHFRLLKALNDFQNIWLSFLSLLAININYLIDLRQSKKLPLQREYVEMLVALLRFLVPDTTRANNSHKVGSVLVTVKPVYTPPPKGDSWNRKISTSGDISISAIKDDVLLLNLTWRSILGVCPQMPVCLNQSHPYMVEILERAPADYLYPEDDDTVSTPLVMVNDVATLVPQPPSVLVNTVALDPGDDETDNMNNKVTKSADVSDSSANSMTVIDNSESVTKKADFVTGNISKTLRIDHGIRKIDARTHIV